MLNVLALTYYFPRISETFVLDQLLFVKNSCNLTIYSLCNPNKQRALEDLEIERRRHQETKELLARTFYEIDTTKFVMLKTILLDHFDILHFQFGEMYAQVEKLVKGRKSILTLHTRSNLNRLVTNSKLKDQANLVLLPTSRYLTEKCWSLLPGLDRKLTLTHYLGVDTKKYCPSESRKMLANSAFSVVLNGRFVSKKGHLTALRAFRIVVNEVPNARLVFIGDGLMRGEIENEIVKLDLTGNVFLTGKLERDEVINIYKMADVGIQPSEGYAGSEEGLPTAIMEYSAMQLAVVATRHAGIPEVVKHNKTGFLIRERDTHDLARRLISLARSKRLNQDLGVRGRNFMVSALELEKQNQELLDIYGQLVKI